MPIENEENARMDRSTWVRGSTILRQLVKDDLILARAIRERRYGDLHAAAVVAEAGVSAEMAMTDPAACRGIRDGITIFFLKGYRCLDIEALAALSAAEPAEAREQRQ